MKILVLENSLDDLLNVKISVNGGQSYTDYNVSSLKNGGLTLDCNPSDLKVICDTNILNYIKVFADGEKLNTGSSGGGATITKQLSAKEIRTSVESEQAITPPEGYDGFSEITFTPGLLSEQIVTENQTLEFGTDEAPYFPKKLTVSVPAPSNYTLEVLSLNKDSEPVTISYADKVFVFLGKIETWGEFMGLGGTASNLLYSKSVTVEDGGATAGIVSIDPDAKTITYTPDTSYNMGSVRITKLII